MKHIAVIIFLLIFPCRDVLCQDNATVIRGQFENWQEAFPLQRIHAFFNQPTYSPGDTVYFSAHFLTEQGLRIEGRQILQLSLFHCTGNQISHINFFVRDGLGFNQIVLPDTLKPGLYEVDIYNDWMKNFDPSLFFHHKIRVVDKNQVDAVGGSDIGVSFFPEGGNFVAGVINKIVLKTHGILPGTGDLIAGTGEHITSFSIDESGLGLIVFTPVTGKSYYARINGKLYNLPTAVSEAPSVLLTPNEDQKPVKVILSATPGSDLRNEELLLLVISHGQIYVTAPLKFEEREFLQVNVPQTNLPAGTAQLWILNSAGKPVASRLFAVAESAPVKVSIKAAPSVVDRRAKISAELILTDASGNLVEGDFSVSVMNEKLFNEESYRTSMSFSEQDRWLITQPSRHYDWPRVLAKVQPTPAYRMSRYFQRRGIAFDLTTGLPVGDSIKISGFFLKNTNGYDAYTNKKGEFDFLFLFDLWESDELFYTAELRGIEQKNVRIKWVDEIEHTPTDCARQSEQPDLYGTFSAKRRMIDRSYGFYTKPQAPEAVPENLNAILEDELSGADISINIHDYNLFPTMAETIREVIPMLKHRIVNGKPIVRAYIDIDYYVPTGDPLYIIDGVMTRDTDFFLSLIPDDVLTVKIVTHNDKLRALGGLGKNGAVFVQTKKQDARRLKSGTVITVNGLNRPANFRPVDHTADPASRKPDFRSTIYWAPLLTLPPTGKKEFSFFASDNTGPLRITVQGLTKDGRPFSATTTCNVTFDSAQK